MSFCVMQHDSCEIFLNFWHSKVFFSFCCYKSKNLHNSYKVLLSFSIWSVFQYSSVSWLRSHDSQSRDLRDMRSQYHKISLAKQLQASFRFQIDSMKIFSEIFSSVYKIILHLILLLAEQHELMIFELKLNVIHKTGDDYISTKHHSSMLSDKRMRRLKFKADELYIMIQSVRQISWHEV